MDVEFRYPGAEESVLNEISCVFEPGAMTAIVGGTGSGKSTLVNLLPRLLDVTSGAVLIDGVDIRTLPLDDLWGLFGIVPQKAFLFGGTIGSNVRFGRPDATDEEVWDALEVAQAREFVDLLPEGLDATVDQGGANFSGGQRQRLAIARCIVREPLIYLFDDSFSALDYTTDARLRAALVSRTVGKTVIIVAQRVSTIMHADRIIVLDGGRIVGTGTHDQLLDGLPGLPGDRCLAGGPGGVTMSQQAPARRPGGPMGGGAPMGMGMGVSDAKAQDFRGSIARFSGRLRPERWLIVLVLVLASTSVFLAVLGPKLLGNATNVIFEGVVGQAATRRASARSRRSPPSRRPAARTRRRCSPP